jgi:hypothetical protein
MRLDMVAGLALAFSDSRIKESLWPWWHSGRHQLHAPTFQVYSWVACAPLPVGLFVEALCHRATASARCTEAEAPGDDVIQ